MTHPNKASTVRLRVLAILIAMSFIAYVLRTNLSFAAPEMMADLGLSEIQWGWVMAAFTAGYTIFQFPGGLLGDRRGPRRVASHAPQGNARTTGPGPAGVPGGVRARVSDGLEEPR